MASVMDKSETVLISIVVTVCVIAVGGISAVVLLLVCKFTNFWKRRHEGRINVAPIRRNQSRNQTRNNRRQSRHGQSASANNPASGSVREPPPYSEIENNPPPIYTPVNMLRDSFDPTSQGTGHPDNETIAYSPPPPYTVLPPRTLITRESSTRGTVNFSRNSFCRPGTGNTNTNLVTPAGIVLSAFLQAGGNGNSRHTSASGSSRHTSGTSRSRQRPPLSNDRTRSSIQHR